MLKGLFSRVGVTLAAGAGLAAVAGQAQATGIDYTGLTSQVDWTSTTAAIMAVAGTLVVLYMAIKGSKIVLSMVRGR